MHRTALLAAVVGGLAASTSFGGFIITTTTTALGNGLQQIDLYALNTGNGTGTGLLTYDITIDSSVGSRVFFRSTAAGAPNVLNTSETPNRSYFRIDDEDSSTTSLVSRTPAAPANWTLAPDQGASTVGQEDFSVAVVSLLGAKPANTGSGAHFAQLIVNTGYSGQISGTIAGDQGGGVPIHIGGDPPEPNVPPVVVSPAAQTVTFGKVVSAGLQFSSVVTATDANAVDILSLTVGTIPAGVSNINVIKTIVSGVATFTVTGLLNYSTNKTTVTIPVNVSDGQVTTTAAIVLNVVPEPTTLAASALLSLGLVRRRTPF